MKFKFIISIFFNKTYKSLFKKTKTKRIQINEKISKQITYNIKLKNVPSALLLFV